MTSDQPEGSFAALFEQQASAPKKKRTYRTGDRIEAVVVQVGRDTVFVELDGKRQAFLEASELRDQDGAMTVQEGDTIRAHVIEADDQKGIVRLGRSMGKPNNTAALEQAREASVAVDGKVTGVNKGGLEIDFGGIRAFCPMSQVDSKFVEDPNTFVGRTLQFLVTEIRDGGKKIVVSRRAVLQREAGESAARMMGSVVPGAVLQGTITSVREFGAFVDLGGIEGLIPISEIAHDRRVAIADAVKAGDTVEVQVREVKLVENPKAGAPSHKISLSLKALTADPWTGLNLVEGRVVNGTVVKVTEFGRFVRLAPGIEGLLHVSELSRSLKAEEGEEIRVVVKKLDRASKKISLVPAPDDAEAGATVTSTVPTVGAIVQGSVERIETYGVFVQLDGTNGRAGRGLVPNAELGVPRGTDMRKTFPEGTKVTAKVLETGDGRLRLSIKGAKDDDERSNFEQARVKQGAPASLGTFADLMKKKR